jgi:hypothetical protein
LRRQGEGPGGGFGVQIDPWLEYVIVVAEDGSGEHGAWNGDQVPPALEHVRSLMAR